MDPVTITSTIAISAATSLVTKGADAPANTLNLLWQATIGRIDPYLEKSIKEHRQNVLKYAEDINQEVNAIPPDKINQSPDIGVLGPALEASKYYVEDEVVRKMFVKLIGAELDLRKSHKIHHSFVDIIRQMNSNDARLLPLLPGIGPLAEIKLSVKNQTKYMRIGPQNILFIPPTVIDNFENNAVSLNNLDRLGLIELDHLCSLQDQSIYEPYKNLSYYQQALKMLSNNSNLFGEVKISKGSFTITSYGELFKSICL